MEKFSDNNLIISYQEGNKKAFSILVKRWHLHFCKLAFWYVKDPDISKDIAKESWTIIYNKLQDLKEPDKFKCWATSIVNRKAIDWLRADKRQQINKTKYKHENKVEIVQELKKENQNEIIELLKKEVDKLSDNQKIIINLFYKESYSLKQISSMLNISVGTAKSRLFHAREKLKKSIKNKKNE